MRGLKFMTSNFSLTMKSWDLLFPHCWGLGPAWGLGTGATHSLLVLPMQRC